MFCDPGDVVAFETRDAFDGQIDRLGSGDDVLSVDLTRVHPLTGPVFVNGAAPGDLLEVEILSIDAADSGYTLQVPGFGFLRQYLPDLPFLARWSFAHAVATCERLPGVRILGAPFPGTIGVAPSRELLAAVNAREHSALDQGGAVLLPDPTSAVPRDQTIASEAWRTIPPRETGGNIDIRHLQPGTSVFVPVFVEGALLSIGDVHFAQGDAEACGTAIEMRSTIHVRVNLERGAAARRGLRNVALRRVGAERGDRGATAGDFFATTGIPVTSQGENRSEDLTLAATNALLNMIEHLVDLGWTQQQAYIICSVAVDLKISAAVDVPNMLVSAFLPLDIFEA